MPACEVEAEITDNIPDAVNAEDRQGAPYMAKEQHGDDHSGGQETGYPDGGIDMIENHLPALRSRTLRFSARPRDQRLLIQFTSFLAALGYAKRPSFSRKAHFDKQNLSVSRRFRYAAFGGGNLVGVPWRRHSDLRWRELGRSPTAPSQQLAVAGTWSESTAPSQQLAVAGTWSGSMAPSQQLAVAGTWSGSKAPSQQLAEPSKQRSVAGISLDPRALRSQHTPTREEEQLRRISEQSSYAYSSEPLPAVYTTASELCFVRVTQNV